ncbi:unnamed protein product [Ixodes persulcatus]
MQDAESRYPQVSTAQRIASPAIVCTYHRVHANWRSGNISYNLETFPYQYCTSMVYCCVGLDAQFDLDPHECDSDAKSLRTAKKSHPDLKTFVAIGGSKQQNDIFEKIAAKRLHQDLFVHAMVEWLLKRNFDGVYFYWTYRETQNTETLVRAIAYLVSALRKSNLKLGLILPSDEGSLKEFNVPQLAHLLKGAPEGILLSPSERKKDDYNKTYFERADDMLKQFKHLQEAFANVSGPICPMLPFAGSSFKFQAIIQEGNVVLKPVGKGKPGSVSSTAGKLAYFEVCKEHTSGSHFVFTTQDSAIVRDMYITYLTPRALANLLGLAVLRRSFECLGAWEPEWDDFGEVCEQQNYPLLRTLYTFIAQRSQV